MSNLEFTAEDTKKMVGYLFWDILQTQSHLLSDDTKKRIAADLSGTFNDDFLKEAQDVFNMSLRELQEIGRVL